uniref:Uncharacterized protein n=1 Tax=Anguilla anguilla TaxID=7936 RepID=A0A0E9T556_ANGAN
MFKECHACFLPHFFVLPDSPSGICCSACLSLPEFLYLTFAFLCFCVSLIMTA